MGEGGGRVVVLGDGAEEDAEGGHHQGQTGDQAHGESYELDIVVSEVVVFGVGGGVGHDVDHQAHNALVDEGVEAVDEGPRAALVANDLRNEVGPRSQHQTAGDSSEDGEEVDKAAHIGSEDVHPQEGDQPKDGSDGEGLLPPDQLVDFDELAGGEGGAGVYYQGHQSYLEGYLRLLPYPQYVCQVECQHHTVAVVVGSHPHVAHAAEVECGHPEPAPHARLLLLPPL